MKLHSHTNPALNTVTAYGANYIEINRQVYTHAIHFTPEGEVHAWAVTCLEDITAEQLGELAGLSAQAADPMAFLDAAPARLPAGAPEVMLIGTGLKQHFLPPQATRALLAAGVGIEIMSTQAAARTYNILMSEGRRVLAALLPQENDE